jgi:hypothetical protein
MLGGVCRRAHAWVARFEEKSCLNDSLAGRLLHVFHHAAPQRWDACCHLGRNGCLLLGRRPWVHMCNLAACQQQGRGAGEWERLLLSGRQRVVT